MKEKIQKIEKVEETPVASKEKAPKKEKKEAPELKEETTVVETPAEEAPKEAIAEIVSKVEEAKVEEEVLPIITPEEEVVIEEEIQKDEIENPIKGADPLLKIVSEQATKWQKWLKLHGSTPERFLEKYPNHPAKKYVEELV